MCIFKSSIDRTYISEIDFQFQDSFFRHGNLYQNHKTHALKESNSISFDIKLRFPDLILMLKKT